MHVAVWKEGDLQRVSFSKTWMELSYCQMRMNANVQVRGGEMVIWKVRPFWCQRVSAAGIVHTIPANLGI